MICLLKTTAGYITKLKKQQLPSGMCRHVTIMWVEKKTKLLHLILPKRSGYFVPDKLDMLLPPINLESYQPRCEQFFFYR